MGKAELKVQQDATTPPTPAVSCGSQTKSSEKLQMTEKVKGQKMRKTALVTDRNVSLSIANETKRSTLQRRKLLLAHLIPVNVCYHLVRRISDVMLGASNALHE